MYTVIQLAITIGASIVLGNVGAHLAGTLGAIGGVLIAIHITTR
jgi:hypothetical protein